MGRREAPYQPAIVKLVQKFELLGQVSDVKNRTRAYRARTPAKLLLHGEKFDINKYYLEYYFNE